MAQETLRENKMGTMPENRLLLSMAVPMMISMLVQALYNIVDSVFVSRVSEQALTAVSLAFPAQNLMIGLATGTAVGVNALLGGVLALVFNTLAAGFVPEGSGIVVRLLVMIPILLIGHGINLFMSTISSFVHPLRLTFVEFYKNAGFEMAPRNFDPIRKMNDTNE